MNIKCDVRFIYYLIYILSHNQSKDWTLYLYTVALRFRIGHNNRLIVNLNELEAHGPHRSPEYCVTTFKQWSLSNQKNPTLKQETMTLGP